MEKLTNDFAVAVKIFEYNSREEPVWFAKLANDFNSVMSRVTVSKNIDKLFDLGIINGSWTKIDGKWVRTFEIAGEANALIASIAAKNPSQL